MWGGKGREEGGGVGAPFNVLPPGATDLVAPLALSLNLQRRKTTKTVSRN